MATQRARQQDRWQGRTVKVLDGCGLSMPDTDANRAVYPYAGGQKPGCGFPTGQLVGLFSLCTGHLVKFVVSSWKAHEAPLARQMIGWIHKGEVLLTDRGFCNWPLICLFQRKGVDVVMRLHQARKTGTGPVRWRKPQRSVGKVFVERAARGTRAAGGALPRRGARLPHRPYRRGHHAPG